MKNKTLIIIHGIVYTLFAIVLFFVPDFLWPFYGVEVNDQYARFLSQHNSIFLGGIAVFCFLFSDVDANSREAQKLFKGLLWTDLLGVAITLYACFIGVFVGFGWSDPAFFALLAVLCFIQLGKNSVDATDVLSDSESPKI